MEKVHCLLLSLASGAFAINLPVQRYVLADDATKFETESDNKWVNESISTFK